MLGLGVFRRWKVKAVKAHIKPSGLGSQVEGVQSLEHIAGTQKIYVE